MKTILLALFQFAAALAILALCVLRSVKAERLQDLVLPAMLLIPVGQLWWAGVANWKFAASGRRYKTAAYRAACDTYWDRVAEEKSAAAIEAKRIEEERRQKAADIAWAEKHQRQKAREEMLAEMARGTGFVYVLVNQYSPSVVKVGMTTNTAALRAREISRATGSPGSWEVFAEIRGMHIELEKRVHLALGNCQVHGGGTEIFETTPEHAKQTILDMRDLMEQQAAGLPSNTRAG